MKFSDLPIGANFVYEKFFKLFLFIHAGEKDAALKVCKEYAQEKISETKAFSKRNLETYDVPKDQAVRILE